MDCVDEISDVTFSKCNILGFRLRRNLYHYTLSFPLLRPYCILKTGKPLGSLWEASKFVLFPLHCFVQPILLWIHELIPGFIILSVEFQIFTNQGRGGGGTPLSGLYKYVQPQRVWFFTHLEEATFSSLLIRSRPNNKSPSQCLEHRSELWN